MQTRSRERVFRSYPGGQRLVKVDAYRSKLSQHVLIILPNSISFYFILFQVVSSITVRCTTR